MGLICQFPMEGSWDIAGVQILEKEPHENQCVGDTCYIFSDMS